MAVSYSHRERPVQEKTSCISTGARHGLISVVLVCWRQLLGSVVIFKLCYELLKFYVVQCIPKFGKSTEWRFLTNFKA
jgi:hypothetical protein